MTEDAVRDIGGAPGAPPPQSTPRPHTLKLVLADHKAPRHRWTEATRHFVLRTEQHSEFSGERFCLRILSPSLARAYSIFDEVPVAILNPYLPVHSGTCVKKSECAWRHAYRRSPSFLGGRKV